MLRDSLVRATARRGSVIFLGVVQKRCEASQIGVSAWRQINPIYTELSDFFFSPDCSHGCWRERYPRKTSPCDSRDHGNRGDGWFLAHTDGLRGATLVVQESAMMMRLFDDADTRGCSDKGTERQRVDTKLGVFGLSHTQKWVLGSERFPEYATFRIWAQYQVLKSESRVAEQFLPSIAMRASTWMREVTRLSFPFAPEMFHASEPM